MSNTGSSTPRIEDHVAYVVDEVELPSYVPQVPVDQTQQQQPPFAASAVLQPPPPPLAPVAVVPPVVAVAVEPVVVPAVAYSKLPHWKLASTLLRFGLLGVAFGVVGIAFRFVGGRGEGDWGC